MVEGLVALVEWLLKFAEVREDRRQLVFDKYVDPMYNEAERVYQEFLRLLTRIKEMLDSGVEVDTIISELEKGRLENKPVRDKLRAILERQSSGRIDTLQFERGVWGILRGGLAQLERTWDYDYGPYGGQSEHTLLDALYHLRALQNQDPQRIHKSGSRKIAEQLKCLDLAWQDVVKGYAELQSEIVR